MSKSSDLAEYERLQRFERETQLRTRLDGLEDELLFLEDEGYDLALDLQEEKTSFAAEEKKLQAYA